MTTAFYSFCKPWGYPWHFSLLQDICSSSVSTWLLGSYSELNPFLPCHCSVIVPCHHCIPEEFWDHFLPYSCAFTDWFTQNNQSLFKMCQNTPSCGKMLLTILFLTRLNLKCYLLSAPWNLSVPLLALLFSQLLIPLHPSILSCSQFLSHFPKHFSRFLSGSFFYFT